DAYAWKHERARGNAHAVAGHERGEHGVSGLRRTACAGERRRLVDGGERGGLRLLLGFLRRLRCGEELQTGELHLVVAIRPRRERQLFDVEIPQSVHVEKRMHNLDRLRSALRPTRTNNVHEGPEIVPMLGLPE